jgi:hypothetical protein
MKAQTSTNLFLIAISSVMLTACGGGFGNGGLTLDLKGSQASQSGAEFSNYSSVGAASDEDLQSPSSQELLSQLSPPITEAEAFHAVDSSHTDGMRRVAVFAASADGLGTFDTLTSTGPASDSPYGGVNPPADPPSNPPNPVDPISNPPTGVDNPDTLPTLQASSAKKGAVGNRMVELLQAGRGFLQGLLPLGDRTALAAEAKANAEKLQKLNMTNLSAETQSLIQANILVYQEMVRQLL